MSPDSSVEETPSNFRPVDAYAAGMLDGEGCISMQGKKGYSSIHPRVDIGMALKGLPALQKLQSEYGGRIRKTREKTEKWEEAHALMLMGPELRRFLTAVRPYLVLKKRQADLALSLLDMIDGLENATSDKKKWTPEATKAAGIIKDLLHEANRKGPSTPEPSPGWIARLVGGTWVTPQADLTTPHGLEEFTETWPRSGMMLAGNVFQRVPLALPTDGTDGGSLPTPSATSYGSNQGGGAGRVGPVRHSLESMARNNLWPTPHANCSTGAGQAPNKQGGENLQTAVGGSLNPTWVEWLMGFPLGYTDLWPSATPSSRKFPNSSAKPSWRPRQMTIDEVLQNCRLVKEAGTSSKVPVPIVVLEKLCAAARAWEQTPDYVKDVAKALKGET